MDLNIICDNLKKFGLQDIIKEENIKESDSNSVVYKKDDHTLKVDCANEELKVEYIYKPDIRSAFMKYCKNLDDDVFVETCELFSKYTGKSMEYLENNITEKNILTFLDCVKTVVLSKVEKLNKMLEFSV